MDATSDAGVSLLNDLYRVLQIDPQWSLQSEREFTWWPYRLAQRVWVELPRVMGGNPWVRLHAETDLLRNVPNTSRVADGLALLNSQMLLSASVWYPEERRVTLHSTIDVAPRTVKVMHHLAYVTVALQASEAHGRVDALAGLVGCEVNATAHPQSGTRPEPDDMLNVIVDVFRPLGQGPSPFIEADFKALSEQSPHPWVLLLAEGPGFAAELPCASDVPAVAVAARMSGGQPLGTALLTAWSQEPHPGLGSGLHLLLKLPEVIDPTRTADLCWRLNLEETLGWNGANLLGAWCVDPQDKQLAFTAFLPAVLHQSGPLATFYLSVFVRAMAERAPWAFDFIHGAKGPLAPTDKTNRSRPWWAVWRS